jgi:SAM-dependent methyltransferase
MLGCRRRDVETDDIVPATGTDRYGSRREEPSFFAGDPLGGIVSSTPAEGPTAADFDQAFAEVDSSPALLSLFTATFDNEFPPEVQPYSYVPLSGLREIAIAVGAGTPQSLVDVGCGRGGPGLWVARELGCRLTGVDFSAVAVRQAGQRAPLFDIDATFRVGSFDRTGLPDAAADAVISVDAMHFPADTVAAAAELLRICVPGGRLAVTTWRASEGPARLQRDIVGALRAAGWTIDAIQERPEWLRSQAALYDAALALTPEQVSDEPSFAMLQSEARQVGAVLRTAKRYLIVATR